MVKSVNNPYETLSVSEDASPEDIKKAYRRLVMELHPDRTGNDPQATERMKAVNEAYAVLSDDEKRATFDRGGDEHGFIDVGQQISDFFGGFANIRREPRRGRDVVVNLNVTLHEAFVGCKKDITFSFDEPCRTCVGTGDDPNSQSITCPLCHGKGAATIRQGFITLQTVCQGCGGKGSRRSSKCGVCSGHGHVHVDNSTNVDVPPGVDTGHHLRLENMGQWGAGGQGSAYVSVNVKEDKNLKREGDDLFTSIVINVAEAALGCVKSVKLPDGSQEPVIFNEGTQPGQIVIVTERGMPNVHTTRQRGNLKVRATVKVPTRLTEEQRRLFDALANTL